MSTEEYNWNGTADRFIAFIDVMGFKNMVMNNDHKEVLEKMNTLEGVRVTVIDGENPNMLMETNLKSSSFSDSFVVFSASDRPDDLLVLIHQLRILLGVCFGAKIPLKGTLSFGKVTTDFDKSIFFGQPIIDACALYGELHMLGIILDHNVERKIAEYVKDERFNIAFQHEAIQYKTPTKSGKINHYCVNWPEVMLHRHDEGTYILKDRRNLESLYTTVSGSSRMYIDNTIDFFDFLLEEAKKQYRDIQEYPRKD